MIDNEKIWLVTGDLGYKIFDKIREDFPNRFLNAGASEQAAAGICCGLALEGRIPFFYSITTFLLYRPFETWRTYINHERIPVIGIGSGRDHDYAHDGISHWSDDAKLVLATLPHITTYFPNDKEEIPAILNLMIKEKRPTFLSLRR